MVKKMVIAIVACLCLFWVGSILKCEILTLQYGKQFDGLYEQTRMIDEVDYWKVMEYSDSTARVYYVTKQVFGNIVTFEKQNGQWQMKVWECVWSHYGSASDFIWPYVR